MRTALQYISWLVGFPLNLLVIAALLRGAYRRFPAVLAYSVALILTGVVEVAAYQGYFSGVHLAFSPARYYWLDEGIRQSLLFAVVISLLYHATSSVRSRALVRVGLIVAAVLFAGVSLLIHYDGQAPISRWMTQWTRDLNFGSALLDMALWAILIATRRYEWTVLMLSGALGIQFTGEAIGQALRNQFPSNTTVADVLNVAANWACPYIWWQVFRASPEGKPSVAARSPHS